MSGKPTLMDSYSTDKTYSVCKVDVYKAISVYVSRAFQVQGLIGSVFADAATETC